MTKFRLLQLVAGSAALCCTSFASAEDLLVGFVSPEASQPGQAMASKVMEKMVPGLSLRYRMLDAHGSPDRQVTQIDTLVTLGAKAITSWSIDPNAAAAAYTRANAQGVGIVGINSDGPGVNATIWWQIVRCDKGGAFDQQAAWIKARRPDAKIIIMGGPPVPSIQHMTECFEDAAKNAGLKILARVDNTKDNIASAATLASDVLVRYPNVNIFWGYNDSSALGISAAVLAAGKPIYAKEGSDGLMIFGINGDDEAIAALREGRITATWDPDVAAMGAGAVLAMKNVLANPGQKVDDLVLKSQFITFDSVKHYVPTMERNYTLDTIPLVR